MLICIVGQYPSKKQMRIKSTCCSCIEMQLTEGPSAQNVVDFSMYTEAESPLNVNSSIYQAVRVMLCFSRFQILFWRYKHQRLLTSVHKLILGKQYSVFPLRRVPIMSCFYIEEASSYDTNSMPFLLYTSSIFCCEYGVYLKACLS